MQAIFHRIEIQNKSPHQTSTFTGKNRVLELQCFYGNCLFVCCDSAHNFRAFVFRLFQAKVKKNCGKRAFAPNACKLSALRPPPSKRAKHNKQSLPSNECPRPAMHGERMPELLSGLQGGGKTDLPCVCENRSSRRLFGFAAFQQDARKKARYDCRLQSMSAQRSQMICSANFA